MTSTSPPPKSPANSISTSSSSFNKLIIGLILYISTGIAQPILVDTLRLHSLLGHKYLLLPTLANTTGMALCGLLASTSKWNEFKTLLFHNNNNNATATATTSNLKQVIMIASLVDLISGMCLTFGILLTGGAIFVILYNSCPVWTALLSRFLLGKKLGTVQMIGVVLVCIGLVTNVFGTKLAMMSNNNGNNNDNQEEDGKDEEQQAYKAIIIFGSLIVLVGSLLHSLMFVISDWALSRTCSSSSSSSSGSRSSCSGHDSTTSKSMAVSKNSISGEVWSCCLGTIEALFMLLWVVIGILTTGFQDKEYDMANPISSVDGKLPYVIGGFILLVLVDAIHAAAFFTLLKNIGAVASALLKGLQMVIVILLSAFFFCSRESSQCLTPSKGLSAFFVLSGVICYGLGKKESKVSSSAFGNVNDKRVVSPVKAQNSVEMKPLMK